MSNVVVEVLKTDNPGNEFLIHSEELDRTNYTTIYKLCDKAMGISWSESINYDNIFLIFNRRPTIL